MSVAVVTNGAGRVVAWYERDDEDRDPGLDCRVYRGSDGDAVPHPGGTREIDGLVWPISYAGAVAASYLRRFGDRVLVDERADVVEHVAAVHGWPYLGEVTCPSGPGSPSASSPTPPSPSPAPSGSAADSPAAPATTRRPTETETAP